MKPLQAGFTLIELLIVVVIIGILAAIAIPKFTSTRQKAFVASMKSDLRNLAVQQDLYHLENFTFAASLSDLTFTTSDGVTVTISEGTARGWAATAQHSGIDGAVCEIFNGNGTPTGPATVEGQMACSP